MKIVRIFFAVLILVIIVCVLAIIGLAIFVDPNRLKPMMIAEITKRSGFQTTIDGKLSWSFYPRLGIQIEHMSLRSPEQATPFLDLRHIVIASRVAELVYNDQKLQANVDIAEIRLMGLHVQHAHIGLDWKNNVLTLAPITASLYGGTFRGTAHGQELLAMPEWDWNVQFNRIQLKPLLIDINGANSKIQVSGIGQIKLQAATEGKTKEQMLSNLNGTTEFSVMQGAVEGIDINYLVQTGDAIINKQIITAPTNFKQTNFDSLTGSALIMNGAASTNNLLLLAPALSVKMTGTVNLISQVINLKLKIVPKNVKTTWEIPAEIGGTLNQPDVRLDTSEIQQTIAKEQIDQFKTKAQEQIKKHIPGKAGEFLQNLLGK